MTNNFFKNHTKLQAQLCGEIVRAVKVGASKKKIDEGLEAFSCLSGVEDYLVRRMYVHDR